MANELKPFANMVIKVGAEKGKLNFFCKHTLKSGKIQWIKFELLEKRERTLIEALSDTAKMKLIENILDAVEFLFEMSQVHEQE